MYCLGIVHVQENLKDLGEVPLGAPSGQFRMMAALIGHCDHLLDSPRARLCAEAWWTGLSGPGRSAKRASCCRIREIYSTHATVWSGSRGAGWRLRTNSWGSQIRPPAPISSPRCALSKAGSAIHVSGACAVSSQTLSTTRSSSSWYPKVEESISPERPAGFEEQAI